jgi:hypothetical protein
LSSVLPTAKNICTPPFGAGEGNLAWRVLAGVLDHRHRVGTRWKVGACEDARTGSWRHDGRRRRSSGDFTNDSQGGGRVLKIRRAHREAIHGRAIGRGQIAIRAHRLGQHATVRLVERQRARGQGGEVL